ncbi:MAG: hypothetical protein LBB48_05040 [Treponema sp.]|jgi:hypothetical protein|nr:hypothetical protein [Treponema sp.]
MKKNDYILPTEEAARFIPYSQLLVTAANPETYSEPMERLNRIAGTIPAIGATEGMKKHPAILHYFITLLLYYFITLLLLRRNGYLYL